MIVKNAIVYDSIGEKYSNKNLLIEKGVIVDNNLSFEPHPLEHEVYDLAGKYLHPAFIDSHCHLVGTGKSISSQNLEKIKNKSDLVEIIKIAESEKISIKIHTIGDGALDIALEAFSKAISSNNPLRHKLVHVQLASEEQLKRIRNLNLLITIQPRFLTSDQLIASLKPGKTRRKKIGCPYQKMHSLGLNLSFSPDSPIENLNPFVTFTSSDQWVDRKIAFKYFTFEAAKSIFQESKLGSSDKGKFTDAFVCSKDIFSIPTANIHEIN